MAVFFMGAEAPKVITCAHPVEIAPGIWEDGDAADSPYNDDHEMWPTTVVIEVETPPAFLSPSQLGVKEEGPG